METIKTEPFLDQKPGTSGLRKKTKVFQQTNYTENFVQATFNALGKETISGSTLVLGGDGRFHNATMIQSIIKMCAANDVSRVWVGVGGRISTPAVSAIIRRREGGGGVATGGFILTASHNPGGQENDVGIKYNVENGGPAPESVTDAIFLQTKAIREYYIRSDIPDIDLSKPGKFSFLNGEFIVEVIDPTEDYVLLLKEVFDFPLLKRFLARPDFSMVYDAMHGVGGPYAVAILHHELGVEKDCLMNCVPKEDFGGGHPDPNLTYAHDLVELMGLNPDGSPKEEEDAVGSTKKKSKKTPDLGAASDGDADRNMILGSRFFVTPSDSLAVIAANAAACIPFFKFGGLVAVARSMPTSAAVDLVAKKLGIPCFEVPTGWKYFGNLMDSETPRYSPLICGEESFGTGSSHIREKDGIWAILCWLSLLAHKNLHTKPGELITVEEIVRDHWSQFGRNYYCRYDYENVESAKAAKVTSLLTNLIATDFRKELLPLTLEGGCVLAKCDEFEYLDPVDGSVSSHQGWRFLLQDGSRFVFRLSGTGSSGATIRLYLEKYQAPDGSGDLFAATKDALGEIIPAALNVSKLEEFTGMSEPTVIT